MEENEARGELGGGEDETEISACYTICSSDIQRLLGDRGEKHLELKKKSSKTKPVSYLDQQQQQQQTSGE